MDGRWLTFYTMAAVLARRGANLWLLARWEAHPQAGGWAEAVQALAFLEFRGGWPWGGGSRLAGQAQEGQGVHFVAKVGACKG